MSTGTGDTLERDAAILAAAYSPQELRDSLALWKGADAAVAGSQSYTIAGRNLTRADAAEIRKRKLRPFYRSLCVSGILAPSKEGP